MISVLMPNGIQSDIDAAQLLVDFLGIRHYTVNIRDSVEGLKKSIPFELSRQSEINLPARIRMVALYAVSQSNNGRVANTCNLSEDWVGYATRYGDGAGDFSPCCRLTVQEVKAIGRVLGLPEKLKDFNNRVTMVLIRNIETYLTKIGIDMGIDENVSYNITVKDGQINIAIESI